MHWQATAICIQLLGPAIAIGHLIITYMHHRWYMWTYIPRNIRTCACMIDRRSTTYTYVRVPSYIYACMMIDSMKSYVHIPGRGHVTVIDSPVQYILHGTPHMLKLITMQLITTMYPRTYTCPCKFVFVHDAFQLNLIRDRARYIYAGCS